MSLQYADWLRKKCSDIEIESGQMVWDACLRACADHCRKFGEEVTERQLGGLYAAIQYQKEFMKLTNQIEGAQDD